MGRREGLKILFGITECGFESRSEHLVQRSPTVERVISHGSSSLTRCGLAGALRLRSSRIGAHCPNSSPHLRHGFATASVLAIPSVPIEIHEMKPRLLRSALPHLPQFRDSRIRAAHHPWVERVQNVLWRNPNRAASLSLLRPVGPPG